MLLLTVSTSLNAGPSLVMWMYVSIFGSATFSQAKDLNNSPTTAYTIVQHDSQHGLIKNKGRQRYWTTISFNSMFHIKITVQAHMDWQ